MVLKKLENGENIRFTRHNQIGYGFEVAVTQRNKSLIQIVCTFP